MKKKVFLLFLLEIIIVFLLLCMFKQVVKLSKYQFVSGIAMKVNDRKHTSLPSAAWCTM